MSQIIFGYWKVRGLGQNLRLLLAYSGLDFQEVQYDNREKWFNQDKVNIGFDFPNLPYLLDGEFKLTESSAIARYIIKRSGKTDLLGKTPEDEARVNNLLGVLADGMKDIRGLYWNKDYEATKIEVLEKARSKFNYLRDFIGNKDWALGYLTLVDFVLAEMLAYFETLYPSQYKNYGFWWRIQHNFDELPEIRKYYERADAVHGPYVPPYAALQPTSRRIKVGYWGIRGKAQVIRLLLSFSKKDFQDVIYTTPEKWFQEDKLHLGLDFPNLPYLINGQFKLTEASAIQKYVITKWGNPQLLGKNAHDEAQIDSFLSILDEIVGAVIGLFFNKDHQTARPEVIKKYAPKLQLLNKFVGQKNFALGYLTLIDFIVAEYSHYIETVFPEEYKAYPFLARIRENFENLPETKAYYSSETAFKGRFLPPTAFYSVEK